MNSNQLKAIACVSMLLDHVGLLFFPDVVLFRILGRIAMPIFAFFIGEGCYHTRKPLRYFLRVFGLGLLCQSVYLFEQLLTRNFQEVYLNILFTFSLSIPICFLYFNYRKVQMKRYRSTCVSALAILFGAIGAIVLFDIFCTFSQERIGIAVTLDYGAIGALLPLFAVLRHTPEKQRRIYAFGVLLFALISTRIMWYAAFSLLAIPLLWHYNGERGSKRLQPVFYLFYPLHLGVLYLIDLLI